MLRSPIAAAVSPSGAGIVVLYPHEGETKGLRLTQWRCLLAVRTGERPNPLGFGNRVGAEWPAPYSLSDPPANADTCQEDGPSALKGAEAPGSVRIPLTLIAVNPGAPQIEVQHLAVPDALRRLRSW